MTTIEELRREADALVVCGGMAALLRKAASEIEALQKENIELKFKNIAWALGIEQSNTDIVDMQRDEFRRILAILHGCRSHSDQEIIDICNRAIACIEQTVPVVVQRDSLRARVAELEKDKERLLKTFQHRHVNDIGRKDSCLLCGLDLRDEIHIRAAAMSAEKK